MFKQVRTGNAVLIPVLAAMLLGPVQRAAADGRGGRHFGYDGPRRHERFAGHGHGWGHHSIGVGVAGLELVFLASMIDQVVVEPPMTVMVPAYPVYAAAPVIRTACYSPVVVGGPVPCVVNGITYAYTANGYRAISLPRTMATAFPKVVPFRARYGR